MKSGQRNPLSVKRYSRSRRLFEQAVQVLPGGVDSPVRAFKAVGATPLFIKRAAGGDAQR